jgi:hypothetical protein
MSEEDVKLLIDEVIAPGALLVLGFTLGYMLWVIW